jgi:hypothetical protein
MVGRSSGCLIGHDQLNPNAGTIMCFPKHAWLLPVDYFVSAVVFKTNLNQSHHWRRHRSPFVDGIAIASKLF